MLQTSDLLTIQKFIFLLDDFHYEEFTRHLLESKAELPLKLSHVIRKKLPEFDGHEGLCVKIYGKYEKNERLAFNQLASYTFKLSANLSINYPAYLSVNYPVLQRLINKGQTAEGNFLGKAMLEIAEKIEDHSTQIFVLKFFIQQAFLMKQSTVGVKYTNELDAVYDIEKQCHHILSILRLNLNIALDSAVDKDKIAEYKKLFLSHHNHSSCSLRLLSKYAYIYTLYFHDPEQFKDSSTGALIDDLEKDLNNYSYIVFPFGFDIKSNFSFYKLNSQKIDLTSKAGQKDFDDLKKHYSSVQFWNSYLNIPEIFAMALKASNYLTAYHHYVHRADYYKMIPADVLQEIKSLSERCKELLKHSGLEKYYKHDLINLELLYSGLLILSAGPGIKKGAEELESVLILYQQVNLAGTTDSIFLFLMIAYFAMRQYDKCAQTFKRYVRITKGKSVYEDNDVEIHIYYYLSQWLAFKSNQYLVKLKSTYSQVAADSARAEQAKAIEELSEYFELPVDLVSA